MDMGKHPDMDTPVVRSARQEDAGRLLEIYRYYVFHTAITFDYEPPSPEEFAVHMCRIRQRNPFLVIERQGKIEGYAFSGPFVGRKAYDWSRELTIYLDPDARGCGMGRMLYEALEEELKRRGIKNLYACIGYPDPEDEYLTSNSADFHAHMGFVKVGEFHRCGYKFGRWYHMIWMEKLIGWDRIGADA